MGRGRQKAKQTKVARQLKYYSPETDYKSLERELGHPGSPYRPPEPERPDEEDDGYDGWASGSSR
ncbi:DUF3073 domain-containing protein [Pseudokineococcus basanitobsidens]|uniref:DUF3073 domain-containing protein n=1 Tax=Pseudokineococcus basanitobsidens TaxID=1926649 RepID=A0ABU8RLM4_9ACTN